MQQRCVTSLVLKSDIAIIDFLIHSTHLQARQPTRLARTIAVMCPLLSAISHMKRIYAWSSWTAHTPRLDHSDTRSSVLRHLCCVICATSSVLHHIRSLVPVPLNFHTSHIQRAFLTLFTSSGLTAFAPRLDMNVTLS